MSQVKKFKLKEILTMILKNLPDKKFINSTLKSKKEKVMIRPLKTITSPIHRDIPKKYKNISRVLIKAVEKKICKKVQITQGKSIIRSPKQN